MGWNNRRTYGPAYHSEWQRAEGWLLPQYIVVFQDDNARTHRARLVENMLKLKQCSVWNGQILAFWDMTTHCCATKAACYFGDCTSRSGTVFLKV
ncbi:hypothetical protein TNCV_2643691 [Trichonephila clavipes]|nr:hypothetical protein TNCV_2643691 [Trichonephila clavipes]